MPTDIPSLRILQVYARLQDPSSLPSTVLFHYTDNTITVFDAYPKANFHLLVLPRIKPPLRASKTSTLKALLNSDKEIARKCINDIATDAKEVHRMVEKEMVIRFGCKWPIWSGFHAVQSME